MVSLCAESEPNDLLGASSLGKVGSPARDQGGVLGFFIFLSKLLIGFLCHLVYLLEMSYYILVWNPLQRIGGCFYAVPHGISQAFRG